MYQGKTRVHDESSGNVWVVLVLLVCVAFCRRAEGSGLSEEDVFEYDLTEGQDDSSSNSNLQDVHSYNVVAPASSSPRMSVKEKAAPGMNHNNNQQYFIKNEGQWNERLKFSANVGDSSIQVLRNGSVRYFIKSTNNELRIALEATIDDDVIVEGYQKRNHPFMNYFVGPKENHREMVPTFNGVDVSNSGPHHEVGALIQFMGSGIKTTYTVDSGELASLVLQYSSNSEVELKIELDGSLTIQFGEITWKETMPEIFQRVGEHMNRLNGQYLLLESIPGLEGVKRLGYQIIGEYQRNLPLVIDPLLIET